MAAETVFKSITCASIGTLSAGSIYTATTTDNLANLLKVLVTKNIYSVPIFSKEENKYVAMIEIGDLVAVFIELLHKIEQEATTKQQFHEILASFPKRWESLTVEFLLKDTDRHAKFQALPQSASIYEAIKLLESSKRRVPIVDSNNQIVQIVSPFLIIAFIGKHMDKFGDKIHKTVKELGAYTKKTVLVDQDTLAIQTFTTMVESGVSGVGIMSKVNSNIIAVISLKDIKLAITEGLDRLGLTTDQYIKQVRGENFTERAPSVYCSINDPIEKVIAKLIGIRIHRVFLRDTQFLSLSQSPRYNEDSTPPVGVLSVWDIISAFM